MKTVLRSIHTAFSMFTRIPMPRIAWRDDNMRYMMAAFPLVGIVIGALLLLWLWIAARFELPASLSALGITLIPLAITGGLHLDGLCDTSDALGANTTPERRREILKDPRAGAFGVIGAVVYLVAYYALALTFATMAPELENGEKYLLAATFVFSRTLSAFAIVSLPSVADGTAKMFRDSARRNSRIVLDTLIVVLAIGSTMFSPDELLPTVVIWIAVATACFFYLRNTACKKFGGMSGDLAGWFLQLCELWQLAAVAVTASIIRGL